MNMNTFLKTLLVGFIINFTINEGASYPKSAFQPTKTILDEPACVELKTFCNNFSENDDMLIIECLQSVSPERLSKVNAKCQDIIWDHIRELISDDNVNRTLSTVCKVSDFPCTSDKSTKNNLLKCIVNNKDKVNDIDCTNMIFRLENAAFQDYRWIGAFLDQCGEAIKLLHCGRLDEHSFSQLKTVVCLQNSIASVDDECKKEVFKLSELQAENIKLDQQLFLECAEDHTTYCQDFLPSSARVFSCLMDQPPERLSAGCRKNLLRRQKLIAQDYHMSKGLMRTCKEDIKKAMCRKRTSGDKNTRLAQVLLCLESVAKNGTKLDPQCEVEMIEHRRLLMMDYRLSPEIVDGCKEEIKQCPNLETGGKTLHCLMERAKIKNGKRHLSDVCQRALEALIKETDAGENWSVDPVVHEACYPVVKLVCSGLKGGDAKVMNCLMDNIGADHMTDECEDALIQIQYFIARDYKLDPQLYRACRNDAGRLCHAAKAWDDPVHPDPQLGPQVLPCLYRNAYHNDDAHLDKTCLQQIRRVMRQRAVSVDLHPEIEEACLSDLAEYCAEKTSKGEEILCLQNNFDELDDKCQEAIETYTEAEAEHAELNPYIISNCRKEMETLCITEMKNDKGDIMECLISHKNDPTVKANPPCRTSIEHYQIISLKNYRFTYKFKAACKNHAMRFCAHARTKNEVVACLSEKVTNDTIQGRRSDITKECRQQLKSQLFQQRENIDFDPKLKTACSEDIQKYCSKIPHGSAQVLECLQTVPHDKLTAQCEQEIFKVKKQEMTDNSVDYALISMCSDVIEQFCPNHEKSTVLECLRLNKDQKGFNKQCRTIVMHRIKEQNSNYLLNPSLQENCKLDIKKFCMNQIQNNKGNNINETVIKCLKSNFKIGKLTNKCEKEIVSILREQALNIELNPLLQMLCKNELETICRFESEDMGNVEECLKTALLNKKIVTRECQVEVATMIGESTADINVDPLLQEACSLDLLKLCANVPQGNGRHISCLRIIMEDHPESLTPDCRNKFSKRLEMFKQAALVPPQPQSIQEIYDQVVMSPSKYYFFLMVIMVFGSVFVIGMFCGRTTRRHMLLKNK